MAKDRDTGGTYRNIIKSNQNRRAQIYGGYAGAYTDDQGRSWLQQQRDANPNFLRDSNQAMWQGQASFDAFLQTRRGEEWLRKGNMPNVPDGFNLTAGAWDAIKKNARVSPGYFGGYDIDPATGLAVKSKTATSLTAGQGSFQFATLDDVKAGRAGWTDMSEADRAKALADPNFYSSNQILNYDQATQQQILADSNFKWDNVPAWQKQFYNLSSSPAGMGAVQGALMALPAGGPVAAAGAAVAGATLGYGAGLSSYDQTKEAWQQGDNVWGGWFGEQGIFKGMPTWMGGQGVLGTQGQEILRGAFGWMNFAAEQAEKAIGIGVQSIDAARRDDLDLQDVFTKEGWNAGAGTFEALAPALYDNSLFSNIQEGRMPTFDEFVNAAPVFGLVDVFANPEKYKGTEFYLGAAAPVALEKTFYEKLDEAREKIKNGENYRQVMTDMQTGILAQMGDMAGQAIADPLNVMGKAQSKAGEVTAKYLGNDVAAEAFRGTDGFSEARKKYQTLVQTDQARTIDPDFDVQKMSGFSKWAAGLTSDGRIKAGGIGDVGLLDKVDGDAAARPSLWKDPKAFVKMMASETPQSRAETGAVLFKDNVTAFLSSIDDPHDAARYLQALSTGDNATWAELGSRFAESPEWYTVLPALKDFNAEKLGAIVNAWDATQINRDYLTRIADVLGDSPARLLDDLAKRGTAEQDLNRIAERLRQSTDPQAKLMLAEIEAGTFNKDTLKTIVDIFTGEGALPWNPQMWKAMVAAELSDHFGAWAADRLALDKSPEAKSAFFRTMGVLKQAQSILLLGGSPGYAIQNGLSGMVHLAASGIYGFMTPGQIDNFLNKMGVSPARMDEGVGIGGVVEKASKISDAVRGEGPLTTTKDVLRKVSSSMPFNKLSSWFEKLNGRQAFAQAMKQMWSQSWRRGVGFSKMDSRLTGALKEMGINPDIIYSAIEAGMNQKDIEAALFGRFEGLKSRSLINDAAGKLGIPASKAADMLEKVGVLDELDNWLRGKGTSDEVEAAFSRVIKHAQEQMDIRTGEDVIRKAEKITQDVTREGALAALRVAQDAHGSFTDVWMDHYIKIGEMLDKIKSMDGFVPAEKINAMWKEAYRVSDAEFARMWANNSAVYSGVFDAWVGSGDADALGFIRGMGDGQKAMKDAYDYMRAVRDDHFGKDWNTLDEMFRAWDKVQAGIDAKFEQAFKEKRAADVRMQESIRAIYEKQFTKISPEFGKAVGEIVSRWYDDLLKMNDEIRKREKDFRKKTAGMNAEQRTIEKRKFYGEEKRFQIVELLRINEEWTKKLEEFIRGEGPKEQGGGGPIQPPPPSDAAPTPADAPVDDAARAAEVAKREKAKKENAKTRAENLKQELAKAAEERARKADAELKARESAVWDVAESFWGKGANFKREVFNDKHALRYALMNEAWGGLPDLQSLSDERLTPDLVRKILESRAQEVEAPKPKAPAVKPKGARISPNTTILKAIAELGGLSLETAKNFTGDPKRAMPGLFTKNGMDIDQITIRLAEYDFDIDLNNPDDMGGMLRATELIQKALAGEKVYPRTHEYDAAIVKAENTYYENMEADAPDVPAVEQLPAGGYDLTGVVDAVAKAGAADDYTAFYEAWGDLPDNALNQSIEGGMTLREFIDQTERAIGDRVQEAAELERMAEQYAQAKTAQEEAVIKGQAALNRNTYLEQLRAAFGDKAEMYMAVPDAMAKVWARVTGRTTDEFYGKYWERIQQSKQNDFLESKGRPQGQPGQYKGVWDVEEKTIHAFEAADFTTLVHENAHVFEGVLKDLARESLEFADDLRAVEGWLGVNEGDAWTVAQQEQFAQGWEKYMLEGPAGWMPLGLRRVFATFRTWMLEVYKQISKLDVTLTDDVRMAFGRMLGDDGRSIADLDGKPVKIGDSVVVGAVNFEVINILDDGMAVLDSGTSTMTARDGLKKTEKQKITEIKRDPKAAADALSMLGDDRLAVIREANRKKKEAQRANNRDELADAVKDETRLDEIIERVNALAEQGKIDTSRSVIDGAGNEVRAGDVVVYAETETGYVVADIRAAGRVVLENGSKRILTTKDSFYKQGAAKMDIARIDQDARAQSVAELADTVAGIKAQKEAAQAEPLRARVKTAEKAVNDLQKKIDSAENGSAESVIATVQMQEAQIRLLELELEDTKQLLTDSTVAGAVKPELKEKMIAAREKKLEKLRKEDYAYMVREAIGAGKMTYEQGAELGYQTAARAGMGDYVLDQAAGMPFEEWQPLIKQWDSNMDPAREHAWKVEIAMRDKKPFYKGAELDYPDLAVKYGLIEKNPQARAYESFDGLAQSMAEQYTRAELESKLTRMNIDQLNELGIVIQYGRGDVKYADWYSSWAKLLAQTYTLDELVQKRNGTKAAGQKAAAAHLRAVEKSVSMSSNSQAKAQARNVVAAVGEERIALSGAIEIHVLFPEHGKGTHEGEAALLRDALAIYDAYPDKTAEAAPVEAKTFALPVPDGADQNNWRNVLNEAGDVYRQKDILEAGELFAADAGMVGDAQIKDTRPAAQPQPVRDWEVKQADYVAARQARGDATPIETMQADYERIVKDAIAKGEKVPAEVVAQFESFENARKAKTRAEKGVDAPKMFEAQAKGVQDFGEKLGGARKDKAAQAKAEMEAFVGASDAEIAKKSLSELFPKSTIEKIEDVGLAAFTAAVREAIPTKPKSSWKMKRWVETVKMLQDLVRIAGEQGVDAVLAKTQDNKTLKGFTEKINLLREIPREQWKRVENIGTAWTRNGYEFGAEVDGTWVGGKNAAEVSALVLEKLGKEVEAKPKAQSMQFEAVQWKSSKQIFIKKKGDSANHELMKFDTWDEARAFMKNNHADLIAEWEKVKERENVKETDLRRDENAPRTGADWRQGKDVTGEMFQNAFGFRGVEFGNWVSQGKNTKERQGMLNESFDALHDMADILGVPTQALSLGGQLGLGLGSRGSGWASAHYEPSTIVINLTKTRGAGSLAHEWFHALDHYFQNKRGTKSDFITEQPENYYENGAQRLPAARFEQLKEAGRIRDVDAWKLVEGVRPRVAEKFAAVVKAIDENPVAKRSKNADENRSKKYWSTKVEMAARAFEVYLLQQMAKRGYQNDYLVNVVKLEGFARDPERYPYMTLEEVVPVAEAFDALFDTIETKETEQGMVLFQETQKPQAQLDMFARVDDEVVRSVEEAAAVELAELDEAALVSNRDEIAAVWNFYKDGMNSRTTPIGDYPYDVGAWKVDDLFTAYGRMVDKLVEFDPADLILREGDYTDPKVNDEGRGDDARRYAEWLKEGKNPPPIRVVQMDNGEFAVTDGHRRTAAAKMAGEKIRAWVSYRMDTGKKAYNGDPIYTALTYEGAKYGIAEAARMWEERNQPAASGTGLLPGFEQPMSAGEQGLLFGMQPGAEGKGVKKMDAGTARSLYDVAPERNVTDKQGTILHEGDMVQDAKGRKHTVKGANLKGQIITSDLRLLQPADVTRIARQDLLFQTNASSSRQRLATMQPIPVDSRSLGEVGNVKNLIANALKRYMSLGKVVNQDSGRVIEFPRSGFNKTVSHAVQGQNVDAVNIRVIQNLDDITKTAVFLFSEPDRKGRESIAAIHHFAARVNVDGENVFVGLVVREENKGRNLYYDNHVILGEEMKVASEVLSSISKEGDTLESNYKNRILQWIKKVNTDEAGSPNTLFQTAPNASPAARNDSNLTGEVPAGAMDEAGEFSNHFVSETMSEGWREHVMPLLDAMRETAVEQLDTRKQQDGAFRDMSPEGQKMLRQYMKQVQNEMATSKLATMRWGEQKRDEALLNYSKRYGIDRYLEVAYPYQFFYTRSMMTWAARALERPAWFANYARLKRQQERYENDLPERLRGKIKIEMPWMPDWMGDAMYIDPMSTLFTPAQFTKPFERMQKDAMSQQQEAVRVLQEWAADGTISEDRLAAAMQQQGTDWERALAEAKMRRESEISNPMDFMNAMLGPAWYLTTPYKLATGQAQGVGSTPILNTTRAFDTVTQGTALEGLGNMVGLIGKPEEMMRKKLGMPEFGEYGEYYIDRQLASMAAEGVISAEDAQLAMIERQGEVFDQARERVKMELAMRVPGSAAILSALTADSFGQGVANLARTALPSLFGSGLISEGELKFRGMKDEWNDAWKRADAGDTNAIPDFFAENPEYEAYLAKGKEPEDRMRSFLVGQIWDGYMELGETNQKQARKQMGSLFEQAFLDKETRSYESIPVETLMQWASQFGKRTPMQPSQNGMTQDAPVTQLDLYAPEVTKFTDMYFSQRREKFPNYYQQQQTYYSLPTSERTAYLLKHPELKEYWAWKDKWYDAHPDLVPIFKGEVNRTIDVSGWNPYLIDYVGMYAMSGEKLPRGAWKSLEQQWIQAGRPYGDPQAWLDSQIVPAFMYGGVR